MNISSVVDKIFYYYETYGSRDYIGEPVTQVEHMVQGAMFAEQDNLGPEIVLAVFLHDIGHLLLDNNNEKMGDLGIMRHETKGRLFLESLGIPKPIPELVENHVRAKRYLVTKNPDYYKKLRKSLTNKDNYDKENHDEKIQSKNLRTRNRRKGTNTISIRTNIRDD